MRDLPKVLLRRVKELMRAGEELELVEVCEIKPNGRVLLEFTSRVVGIDPFNRRTCIWLEADEDPAWVCEGDIGRGFRENRTKRR